MSVRSAAQLNTLSSPWSAFAGAFRFRNNRLRRSLDTAFHLYSPSLFAVFLACEYIAGTGFSFAESRGEMDWEFRRGR